MTNRCYIVLLLWPLLLVVPTSAFFFSQSQPVKIPQSVKLLILPGFGNDSIDYTMENSIVASLQECGWAEEQIRVLPVKRSDWLQVFLRGALDWKFWASISSPTRPAFRWYLDLIADEIASLDENEKAVLIGHSAGGWLCRAALGFGVEGDGTEDASPISLNKIAGIVTLGAPNLPPPQGVMDMTRGALRITNERFPGSYHSPSTFYITAVGLAVAGKKQERQSFLERTTVEGFAFNSYEAVCGEGNNLGDGVVPQCSGHLSDALQVNVAMSIVFCITTPDIIHMTLTR